MANGFGITELYYLVRQEPQGPMAMPGQGVGDGNHVGARVYRSISALH